MFEFEVGKLYRWPKEDQAWTFYDNDGKWTNRLLDHKDIFLVLSFRKINHHNDYAIKILTSNGITGVIKVPLSHHTGCFVKLQ